MMNDDCLACHGSGMLADDEGWQYECSVCHGTGKFHQDKPIRIRSVDSNNRLLD